MDESLRLALVDFLNTKGQAPDPLTAVTWEFFYDSPSCDCCMAEPPTVDLQFKNVNGNNFYYEINEVSFHDLMQHLLMASPQ